MRKPRYNIEIKHFLPHRAPMLMKCRTPYLDGDSVETHFEVTPDNIFTNKKGQFTEGGLIELAAQTCSSITGQDFFEDDDVKGDGNSVLGYISAIKKAEVFLLPKIGDLLLTKASLVSRFDTGDMTLCTITSATFRNDDLVVACTFNFLIHEVPR
jgi:predicted hotdog family 3-hydroxylacyl-ACP dehydratase